LPAERAALCMERFAVKEALAPKLS
jgi:hypothetical protein